MILIIVSVITGYLGLIVGGTVGGIIGVLSPGLFILELIYRDLEKNKKDKLM